MRYLFSFLRMFPFLVVPMSVVAQAADLKNTIYIELKDQQRVVIELFADVAPNHVKRIKKLVRNRFYDGVVFHRVIDGFMAQTGDPTGTGTGGSAYPDMVAEFSTISFERGVVGMARSGHPDSANSQFFICFDDAPFLNKKYTAIGRVIEGMEFIDMIKRGDGSSGIVANPDKMEKVRLAS